MSARYRGIHLPFDRWPEPDRAAWQELFREGNVLDGRGAACDWAEATRRTNLKHYARWLGWLNQVGDLDTGLIPLQRASLERVKAYAQVLRETLSSRTVASAVIGLKCVLQKMYPDQDWRWLKDLTNRVDVWADGMPTRTRKILPAEQVFHGALAELERLAGVAPMSRTDQIRYRDALIVALLTCCPVRMRNLTQIEVGKHLRQVGDQWHLGFEAHETKTRQPISYVVAAAVVPWLEYYLAKVRPGFKGAAGDDRLWPGSKGRPVAYDTLYSRVLLTTKRLFGTAVAPHDFRTMAATALANSSPEDALHARPLLGHRSPRTTERHYIRANQLQASARVNAVLQDVRDGKSSSR